MLKSEKGFSLVEIMVSVGLIGALALGYASLTNSSISQQKAMKANLAANSLKLAVESVVAYSESCGKTFGAAPGAAIVVTDTKTSYTGALMDSDGNTIYPVGALAALVEGGLLRVTSWDVRKKAVLSATDNTVMFELGLNMETPNSEGIGAKQRRVTNVIAKLDASNKVLACHLSGSTVSDLTSGGTGAPITEVRGSVAGGSALCPAGYKVISCTGGRTIRYKYTVYSPTNIYSTYYSEVIFASKYDNGSGQEGCEYENISLTPPPGSPSPGGSFDGPVSTETINATCEKLPPP